MLFVSRPVERYAPFALGQDLDLDRDLHCDHKAMRAGDRALRAAPIEPDGAGAPDASWQPSFGGELFVEASESAAVEPGWESWQPSFEGELFVGRALRPVRASASPWGVRAEIAGRVEVLVDARGERIEVRASRPASTRWDRTLPPGVEAAALVEALDGPGLPLALAHQGTYCLHAAAIAVGGRCFALAGPSGVGKSTLAARLGRMAGVTRVADDLLPISWSPRGPVVLPAMPHRSLPPDAQWVPGPERPEGLPLAAVIAVRRCEAGATPAIAALSTPEAARELIANGVAARLFTSAVAGHHLEFCASIAERIPVFALDSPHDRESIPAAIDAVLSVTGARLPA